MRRFKERDNPLRGVEVERGETGIARWYREFMREFGLRADNPNTF